MPGPQQFNREAHPRDKQARCAVNVVRVIARAMASESRLIGSTRGFAHKLVRLDHGITAFDSRRRTLVTGHAWNELMGLVLEWNNRG